MWGKTDINPDYTNSLLLIDSNSGEIKCKFQDVRHDHWDFDMIASPIFTNVKVSKLAQGLPVGGEIENLDDGTLISAFKNRQSFKK